jgi:four helix bundle protein
MERKNKNRGFKQLRVWNQAVELYKFVYENMKDFPYELNKSKSNTLDACHSIQRNIAEGYCRRTVKDYRNFLNYSLASCGELNSSIITFHNAKLLSDSFFEDFDARLFELENGLLKLASSLQKKIKENDWDESYS